MDSVVNPVVDNWSLNGYEWIIYDEMCQAGSLQCVKRCTLVSAMSVALFTGQLRMNESSFKAAWASFDESDLLKEDDETSFKIDNWIHFKTDKKVSGFEYLNFLELNSKSYMAFFNLLVTLI